MCLQSISKRIEEIDIRGLPLCLFVLGLDGKSCDSESIELPHAHEAVVMLQAYLSDFAGWQSKHEKGLLP